MQLENLPCQIFIEPDLPLLGLALAPGRAHTQFGVRPGGSFIVQISDHCRMRLDGEQQIREMTVNPRPDRFVLECSGGAQADRLVDRDGEVVGPEMHQPFTEGALVRQRDAGACNGLREVVGQQLLAYAVHERCVRAPIRRRLARDRLLLRGVSGTCGQEGGQDLPPGGQPVQLGGHPVRAAQRCQQPGARVARGRSELAGTGPKAEAVCGNGRLRGPLSDHPWLLRSLLSQGQRAATRAVDLFEVGAARTPERSGVRRVIVPDYVNRRER